MTIYLRNLSPNIETAILDVSRREHIGLNKATVRLLKSSISKPAVNSDLDEFSGSWPAAEADSFDAALREMRQVNPLD